MGDRALQIKKNWQFIQEKVENSARKAGRAIDDIRCIAVSKTQPVEAIEAAYQCGLRFFGENYVQEVLPKMEALSQKKYADLRWHFIGALQSNKVKLIADAFDYIHSIERASQIQEIGKRSQQKQKILIEVNLAEEKSKSGIAPKSLDLLLNETQRCTGVVLCGFMFMPPPNLNEADLHKYYAAAALLREQQQKYISPPHHLQELSMGTSYDFPIAIEHGATFIRLGTVLFGQRELK